MKVMRVMLCIVAQLALVFSVLSVTARTSAAAKVALECTVLRVGPNPGWVSGDTAVFRLVKYRIRQICGGDYGDPEIVVDHLVLTGTELDGIKVGDKVCIVVRKSETIPARYNAKGIREAFFERIRQSRGCTRIRIFENGHALALSRTIATGSVFLAPALEPPPDYCRSS